LYPKENDGPEDFYVSMLDEKELMVSSLKALENNAGSVKKVIRACVVTAQGEALGTVC
jgi:hypothetical protein